jgi:hypothetical protein
MKYLYKFESYDDQFGKFKSENSELIDEIKDILLDCEDVEIKSTFWICKYYVTKKNPVDSIRIILQDTQNRYFKIEQIQPILGRIKTVTELEGFTINLDIPSEDIELPFNSFIEEFNGEELFRLGMFIY